MALVPIDPTKVDKWLLAPTTADGPLGGAQVGQLPVMTPLLDAESGELWMVIAPAPSFTRQFLRVSGPYTLGQKFRYVDTRPGIGNDANDGLAPVPVAGTTRGPKLTYQAGYDLFSAFNGGWDPRPGPGSEARLFIVNEGTSAEPLVRLDLPPNYANPLVTVCGFRNSTIANNSGITASTLSTAVPGSAFGFTIPLGASPIGADDALVGQAILVTRSDGLTFHKRISATVAASRTVQLLTAIALGAGQSLTAWQLLEPRSVLSVRVLVLNTLGPTPGSVSAQQSACFGCRVRLDAALLIPGVPLAEQPPPQILLLNGFSQGCSGCEYDLNGAEAMGGGLFFQSSSAIHCTGLGGLAPDVERIDEGVMGGWIHSAGRSAFLAINLMDYCRLNGFFIFSEMGVVRTFDSAQLHLGSPSALNMGGFLLDANAPWSFAGGASVGTVARYRNTTAPPAGSLEIAIVVRNGTGDFGFGEHRFSMAPGAFPAGDTAAIFIAAGAVANVDAVSFFTGSGNSLGVAVGGRMNIRNPQPPNPLGRDLALTYTLTGLAFGNMLVGRFFGPNPTALPGTWANNAVTGISAFNVSPGFVASADGAVAATVDG